MCFFTPRLKTDTNYMVSQMAHAKNLGKPLITQPKILYNIACLCVICFGFRS